MQTTILIQGTHCKACKLLIEDVVSEMPEVHSINVDIESGKTILEHEASIDWNHLRELIEGEGDYAVILPGKTI